MGKATKTQDPQKRVRKATTPEMRQHGDYRPDFAKVGGKLDPVVINRGGTVIERWMHLGGWDEPQRRAVAACLMLWARIDRTETPLSAVGTPQGLWMGQGEQDARDRLEDYRRSIPEPYWRVWENVIRWDMPAGQAGTHLETTDRSARQAAKTVCQFVASIIAMREGL